VKAVVKTERGPGHMALLDVPEPTARPGWVVLEVSGAGICGTDVHIVNDEHPYWPPVTLGHEFAGRIAEVGDDVEGWSVGDRVVCEPHAGACGVCHLCRRGIMELCARKRSPGWGIDGALAPFVAVPAHLLHRVPDEVSDDAAVVCEPTAVCVSAFERMPVRTGETVVVIGPGPIGILSALIARATGADRVILLGRGSSARRLAVAAELGLEVWRSDERDVVEDAGEATDGRGVDLVVDTSGSAPAIAAGVRMLRRRGRMCALGVTSGDLRFPYADAMHRALDLTFSLSSSHTAWDGALSLMRTGAIDVERLVTSFPLAAWEDAFAAVAEREVVKAVLRP
jgi:L-iditol 2-dehydrogenase